MDYMASFQISATGMSLEKLRVDTAALNLANAHSTKGADGRLYSPLRVVAEPIGVDFSKKYEVALGSSFSGTQLKALVPMGVTPRLVPDPGHPDADKNGMVSYPGVDQLAEMMVLVTAVRAYEANVAAMAAARMMALKALEIGGAQ